MESSNGRFVAHCPFHKGDREPSFTIYPDNKYWCFGCSRWGDAIKFLVEYKGLSEKEALNIVGEDYIFPKAEKRAIKLKNTLKTGKFLYETAVIYHEYLMEEPGPQKYVLDRGLTLETAKRFLLGYTDGAVLDFNFAAEYELANEVGLLNKSGSEALAHRITIPNVVDGRYVDFMTGRTVLNTKPKYLGLRMPKPLCGFYDSRYSPILFLVEGNFDYLVLRQWGYPAIVASGTHITKSNYMLLRDKQIIYIPDNDDAGKAAAQKIKKTLPNTIVIDYSHLEVKDIGELAVKGNAQALFEEVVSEQLWELDSSKVGLMKSMPNLPDMTPSLLT